MNASKRILAVTELLLVFPASLFMLALFVRELQPASYEPAQSARRLVEWFSARPLLGLDVFLIAMPLAAFVLGCATVRRSWRGDEELRQTASKALVAARVYLTTLLVAGATLVAGCVLAIVALHMVTD
jgi:quinol-cytochrome oxidoreductase complex cytochrome b subunit